MDISNNGNYGIMEHAKSITIIFFIIVKTFKIV